MTSKNRLFIRYLVEFPPETNQELLEEMAQAAQDRMWDMFDGVDDEDNQPTPAVKDITHELVMFVDGVDVQREAMLKVISDGDLDDIPDELTKGKSQAMREFAEAHGIPILEVVPNRIDKVKWLEEVTKWTAANEEQANARMKREPPLKLGKGMKEIPLREEDRKTHKCECAENAVDHPPYQCDRLARKQFMRENKRTTENSILWLCDECRIPGWDTEVE